MIDINELRQALGAVQPEEVEELLDRLEAWENVFSHLGTPDEVGNEWHALSERLEAAKTAWKEADKTCRDLTEKVIPNLRESLEAAEKDRDGVMQQLVRSEVDKQNISEAHKVVTSRLSSLANENVTLRAKIEAMERQEPVAWAATDETCRIVEALSFNQSRRFDTPLYALPGAKGE